MDSPFCLTVRTSTWEHARQIARYLTANDKWIFRGQSNADWNLTTSLERGFQRAVTPDAPVGYKPHRKPNIELNIIESFARRASAYITDRPQSNNYLEWLSIIQHYGGPTRLLDFSHSFYTAAFFAAEFATDDCAVWAINTTKFCLEQDSLSNVNSVQNLNSYIGNPNSTPGVVVIEPFRMHERLSAQQGLFMIPKDIMSSFENNLAIGSGGDPRELSKPFPVDVSKPNDLFPKHLSSTVVKLVIPRESQREMLEDLRAMNVTATTLFPGLDGFARSLHYNLMEFQPNNDALTRLAGL